MSISGRKKIRPITGPAKTRVVTKIRRDRQTAYTANWDAISAEVKRRSGYKCRCCGNTTGPFETDHIIPVSKGGQTVYWNLQCLCHACHSKRAGHRHLYDKRTLKRKQ